jgi:hypothetical protein
MWKNIVKAGSPQMTIWRIRFTGWILDSHLEYEILISTATMVTRKRLCLTIYVQYSYVACLLLSHSLTGIRHNSLRVGHTYSQINGRVSSSYGKRLMRGIHTFFIDMVWYDIYDIYRVFQEECARLREDVPYVKVYRYNSKHLCPKLNG